MKSERRWKAGSGALERHGWWGEKGAPTLHCSLILAHREGRMRTREPLPASSLPSKARIPPRCLDPGHLTKQGVLAPDDDPRDLGLILRGAAGPLSTCDSSFLIHQQSGLLSPVAQIEKVL